MVSSLSTKSNLENFNANDSSHGSELLKGLQTMYRDGRYSDIPLKISEDGRLSVHRVALALLSLTLKPFSGKIGTMERKKKIYD